MPQSPELTELSNTVFPAQVRGLGYTVLRSPEDSVLKQQSPSWVQTRIVQSQNPIWHWSLLYDFLIDNPLKPNAALAYTDLQTLLGFVTARRNSYDDFLFLDTDDNFFGPAIITQPWIPNYPFMLGAIIILGGHAVQVISAPAGAHSGFSTPSVASTFTDGRLTWADLGAAIGGTLWPNPQAQLQVVTDGTNYYSPLQINRGGQGFYEDVTDLASALTVYANGVLTSSYTLSAGGVNISGFASSGLYIAWGALAPAAPVTAQYNYYYRVHFEDDAEDFEKWANQWWTVGGAEGGSRGKGELKLVTSRIPGTGLGPGGSPFPPFGQLCGTNLLILSPTQLTLNQGSTPGFTGFAAGQAGAGAWFLAQLRQQGLGSGGGSATLSNYPDPGIPRTRLCAAYSYTPFSHVPFSSTSTVSSGASASIKANGTTLVGGITGVDFGSFISNHGVLVSLVQGPVTLSNLNFSTIAQTLTLGASLPGFYGDKVIGNAMVLVYYT